MRASAAAAVGGVAAGEPQLAGVVSLVGEHLVVGCVVGHHEDGSAGPTLWRRGRSLGVGLRRFGGGRRRHDSARWCDLRVTESRVSLQQLRHFLPPRMDTCVVAASRSRGLMRRRPTQAHRSCLLPSTAPPLDLPGNPIGPEEARLVTALTLQRLLTRHSDTATDDPGRGR